MVPRLLITIFMFVVNEAHAAALQDAQQADQRSGEASQDAKTSQDTDDRKTNDGLLGGPAVKDTDTAQPDPRFGGGVDRRTTVPFDRWLRVINGLTLSIDQQAAIETIVNAFRQSQRQFYRQFGLEQRELQQEARRLREEGRDIPRDMAQRIQQIRSAAPQAQECQQQVWNVLTMAQQEEARDVIALVREQIARRQQEQQQRRQAMDAMRGDEDAMASMRQDAMMQGGDNRAQRDRPGAESFDWEQSGLDAASLRRLAFLLRHQKSAANQAGSGDD